MEKIKEFDGRKFSFGNIPPMEAVKIEVSIVSLIGEPLFKALMTASTLEKEGAKQTEAEQTKAQIEVLGMAMGLLSSKLDSDELLKMMRKCFEYVGLSSSDLNLTSIDGNIDQVFIGRNRELWEVFIYSLRYNFADFFPASLFDSIKRKMPAGLLK